MKKTADTAVEELRRTIVEANIEMSKMCLQLLEADPARMTTRQVKEMFVETAAVIEQFQKCGEQLVTQLDVELQREFEMSRPHLGPNPGQVLSCQWIAAGWNCTIIDTWGHEHKLQFNQARKMRRHLQWFYKVPPEIVKTTGAPKN